MIFENRNSLERWLIQQQPEPETRHVTVDYTVLDTPQLTKSAESLLARLATPPAERQHNDRVFAATPCPCRRQTRISLRSGN
jgi:hypothetical protein